MNTKKFCLSIILIIAIILKSINIHPLLNSIAVFLSCFIISYNCFNNIYESIKYGIFLFIIFELLKTLLSVNRYVFSEHLENEKDSKKDTEKEVLVSSVETDKKQDLEKTKKELEDLEKKLNSLEGKDEEYKKNVKLDDMSPAQAQRELFRLIDTTNLLKKTMTEMTPVLNEGKKIMKSMQALNMI